MGKTKLLHLVPNIKRIRSLRILHLWMPILLVICALILATHPVLAHGGNGYYQIRGAYVGNYIVHIWTSPGILRTGEVHVDTAVFSPPDIPAFSTIVHVTITSLDGDMPPMTALAGAPTEQYPHTRDALFTMQAPGNYRIEVAISDTDGPAGSIAFDVNVQSIAWPVKLAMIAAILFTAACGIWLLLQTRAFWTKPGNLKGTSLEIGEYQ